MNEIQYKDIFKNPKTIPALKGKSAQARERMLGNANLMQIMQRSAVLINQLMQDEAPYKEQLEQLAVRMVKKMYPVIDEFGIEIEATLGAGNLPPMEPEEPELQMPQPQIPSTDIMNDEIAKRRLINAITQGASIRGALDKPFIEFINAAPDNLLDSYSETLAGIDNSVDKYGETLKKVFGVFHDEQALAMFMAMMAGGNGGGGGEQKGGESEAEFDDDGSIKIRATGLIFPFLIHEIIKGLYEIASIQGFTKSKEVNAATAAAADRLEYEPEDFAVGTHVEEVLSTLYDDVKKKTRTPLVAFEVFLTNLYREDDAAAFVSFIENILNDELTSSQIEWAKDHMYPSSTPLDNNDDDDDDDGGDLVRMSESKQPYRDLEVTDAYIIREFSKNVNPIELKWHRDREDRLVEIIGKTDWKLQLDNQLPTSLNESIFIPAGEWHRLVKGNDKLVLKIYK
jgi:hypothetical protein